MVRRLWTCVGSLLVLMAYGPLRAEEPIAYNRDIRPILADNCFACHGPDSASRKADLRLDQREAALGAMAIVPGKPEESALIERILSEDPEMVMPPPATKKQLSAEQKALLSRWIGEGAEYQPHWSYLPPERPPVPEVRQAEWARNPIDRFILARLEAAGLSPAPEADRRTLARRASLDLTGLPPEPADVEAFLADPAPDAYERLVDRLMQTPAWGEHRGRYWLDAARYADTHGIHFDNFREMWSYRDWVIGAFNRNLPFDQFTIEQLAGDLLPNRTLDQLVASGFNRCNMTTNEGGVIPEEYLVLYTRDRTETTSAVWMGLTANCAVCHDHKFDPLSQHEFYAMAAFFNNTAQGAMDGNIKDTPPVAVVPLEADRATWEALPAQLATAQQQVDARRAAARPDFDAWLAGAALAEVESRIPGEQLALHAPLCEGGGDSLTVSLAGQARQVPMGADLAWEAGVIAERALKSRPDQSLQLVPEAGDFEKDQAFSCGAWVKVPREGLSGALVARMDEGAAHRGWDLWLDGGRLGCHVVHAWPGDAIKAVSKTKLSADAWHHVLVSYDGSSKAAGLKLYVDGVLQEAEPAADTLKNSIRTGVPLKLAQRNNSARINDLALQDLRIYTRALAAAEVSALKQSTRAAYLVGKPAEGRAPSEVEELYGWWLSEVDAEHRELSARQQQLAATEAAIKARATVAHVMQERAEEPMAFVLYRGEYDKRRDEVHPDTPDILPPFPEELPRNRLGFARWLLRPDHPLTARVTVNRFWQEVFGTGLVRTTGDLGVSGELPSNPELLDWLAVEFRESGWDVRRFFKLMVTSATYRQSALATPEKLERDPDNRLLSRGPRYRMDAEMVRDYALAASGLLVRTIGGPSVKPYQPEGVWEAVAMIGSNTRDYRADSGENMYRRSMYTFWKRAAPPASMEIFNAPNRETCTVRRERTNTPLQALVTLNDPQFVEAARYLAERAIREGGTSDATRIGYLAERLLARPLRAEEMTVAQQTLDRLREHYRSAPQQAAQLLAVGQAPLDSALEPGSLAGWTMLTNTLMNLDETLNK